MLKLQKNNEAGKLIVFEGTDGAGKTTLIRMTADYLAGVFGKERILVQKQPTDLSRKTKLFQKMMYCEHHGDINYRAVQLLTLSDRIQHNSEVILPALRKGKIVICDRYVYTSVVNMLARGYNRETWFFRACREIVEPDLAFLVHADPELAIARIKSRPEESARYFDEALLRKVADRFLNMRKRLGLKLIKTECAPSEAFSCVQAELNFVIGESSHAGYGNKLYLGRIAGKTCSGH